MKPEEAYGFNFRYYKSPIFFLSCFLPFQSWILNSLHRPLLLSTTSCLDFYSFLFFPTVLYLHAFQPPSAIHVSTSSFSTSWSATLYSTVRTCLLLTCSSFFTTIHQRLLLVWIFFVGVSFRLFLVFLCSFCSISRLRNHIAPLLELPFYKL